jgi:hypothetical protein
MCACLVAGGRVQTLHVGKLIYSGEVHLAAGAADATDTPNLHPSEQRPRRSPGRLSPGERGRRRRRCCTARGRRNAAAPAGRIGGRILGGRGEPWPRWRRQWEYLSTTPTVREQLSLLGDRLAPGAWSGLTTASKSGSCLDKALRPGFSDFTATRTHPENIAENGRTPTRHQARLSPEILGNHPARGPGAEGQAGGEIDRVLGKPLDALGIEVPAVVRTVRSNGSHRVSGRRPASSTENAFALPTERSSI